MTHSRVVVRNESVCCQNSGVSMEMRGKNEKKEKKEGEVRVKGKKSKGWWGGQETEIRASADRKTWRQGERAVM